MRDGLREICDKRLMITSSLMDDIDFHVKMSPHSEWKAKSLEKLKKTLDRTGVFEATPFTERGQDFEAKVCSFSRLPRDKFFELMEKFCACDVHKLAPFYDQIAGGQFQRTVKADWEVGGQKIFLYGKEDVYSPTKIVDIKTTSSEWKTGTYSSEKNYQQRAQHQIYMCIDHIKDFNYIIAEFIDENMGAEDDKGKPLPPAWKVVDVHQVPIHIEDLGAEEERLRTRITQCLDFLWQDDEMWANLCNVYTRSWS